MHKKFLGKSVTPERKKKKRDRDRRFGHYVFLQNRVIWRRSEERQEPGGSRSERGTKSEEIIGRRGRLPPTANMLVLVLLCVVTFPS